MLRVGQAAGTGARLALRCVAQLEQPQAYPALDCPEGNADPRSNFRMGEAPEVREVDDLALLRRQLGHEAECPVVFLARENLLLRALRCLNPFGGALGEVLGRARGVARRTQSMLR